MGRGDVDDLVVLEDLDERTLNDELRTRYLKKRIYTYVGDILVAVNPYEELGLYGSDVARIYRQVRHVHRGLAVRAPVDIGLIPPAYDAA